MQRYNIKNKIIPILQLYNSFLESQVQTTMPTNANLKKACTCESPYHFCSPKSKSVMKQIIHVLLLYKLLQLWIVVYVHQISIPIPILVVVPKCSELILKKIPSVFYCSQNPLFVELHDKLLDISHDRKLNYFQ